MPHVPNSILRPGKLAPLSQPSTLAAAAPKPAVPRQSRPKKRRASLRPDKISIRKFEVSPDRIFEQMFGNPPMVDEHTGITTNVGVSGTRKGLGG